MKKVQKLSTRTLALTGLLLALVSPAAAVDTLGVSGFLQGGTEEPRPQDEKVTVAGRWATFAPTDLKGRAPRTVRDGSVWWGLRGGAVRYDGVTWRRYTSKDGLMDGEVRSIAQAADGTLWFAGSHGGRAAVTRYDGRTWRICSDVGGLDGDRVGDASVVDGQGNLYLTTWSPEPGEPDWSDPLRGGNGVMRFDGRTWRNFRVEDGLAHNRVYDIAAGPDGSVWVATLQGVSRFSGGRWTTYGRGDGLEPDRVYRLLVARDGRVWCTHGESGRDGVSAFDGKTWRRYTEAEGMPVTKVVAVCQTEDGAIWFGTHRNHFKVYGSKGLLCYRNGSWLRLLQEDGLPGDNVHGIAQSRDGALWLDVAKVRGVAQSRDDAPWLDVADARLVRYRPDFTRLGAVSGRVTYQFGGLPYMRCAGAGIRAEDARAGERYEGQARAGATTDADGRYRLEVFPGAYRVLVAYGVAPPVEMTVEAGKEVRGIDVGVFAISPPPNPTARVIKYSVLFIGFLPVLALAVWFITGAIWMAVPKREAFEIRCPACGAVHLEAVSRCGCGCELQPVRRLTFHGDAGTLFGIHIVNLLLTVLTLGFYYFRGKVKVRSYLHSQTGFEDDRFAYHGTGKELLIGWLKVILCLGLLVGAREAIPLFWNNPLAAILASVLFYLSFLLLFPIAVVGSRRYRLSRTSWRGIRFSFRGRTRDFLKIYVPGLMLTVITIGLYYPYFKNAQRRFLIGHSYFGTTRFDFDGKGADLFGRYVLALVLSALTLGVYWVWFAAERHRYYWAHTSFAGARFRSTIAGGRLLGLEFGNLLLLVFTLGLAWPWTTIRTIRFVLANLALEGSLDLTAIQQEAQAASATGEGLSDLLDVDFLDIDLAL